MIRRLRHDRMIKVTALFLPVATNRESGATARGAEYRRMGHAETASRACAQGSAAVPTCAQVAHSALCIWGPTCMTVDTLRFQQPMYSCSAIRGQPQHRHVIRRSELPAFESFTFTSERLTFDSRPLQPFKGAGRLRPGLHWLCIPATWPHLCSDGVVGNLQAVTTTVSALPV